jgi:transposase
MQTQKTRYLIVGMARSGTTVTHRALYGHPNVCALDDEIRVDPFFTRGIEAFTVGGANPWERENGSLQLFDALTSFEPGDPDPSGRWLVSYCGTQGPPKAQQLAHGMKVAINSKREADALVESLQRHFSGLRIIHVRRRDLVAQCASLERAVASGIWHSFASTPEARKEAPSKLSICLNKFRSYLQCAREVEESLASLHSTHEVEVVDFERDIESDPESCWQRLFRFLDLVPIKPDWVRSKKVAPQVSDYVENADELRRLMKDSRAA